MVDSFCREKRYPVVVSVILFFCFSSIFFLHANTADLYAQVSDEDSLYTVALGAYKNGFLDVAIDQFQEFLRLYPNSTKAPFAWFRIGEAHRVQNKLGIAEVAYAKVIESYPGHELYNRALFRLSGLKFSKKEFQPAISGYQRLIKDAPSSELAQEGRFWLAESLYQMKRFDEALAAYQTFIRESPVDKYITQALFGAGWCFIELGRFSEAAEEFKKALGKNPAQDLLPQIHLKLADSLFEIKDYRGSLKHYFEFTRLRPGGKDLVILKQGYALSQLGEDSEIVRLFKDYLKAAPGNSTPNAQVLFTLSNILFKQEGYDEVQNYLNIFKSSYPRHPLIPEALLLLGNAYLKKKDYPQAGRVLKELIEGYPDRGEAHLAALQMGNIRYQADEIDKAVSYYSQAVSSKDSSVAAEARYRLAESYIAIGDTDKAIAEFHALEKSSPGQSVWLQMGRFRLGNLYEKSGDKDLARESYRRVIDYKGGTQDLILAAQKRLEELSKGFPGGTQE